ncbi:ERF family protein [Listeria monocytogenes]|uniref:ERF family protein n=1 Tax=Listeria monocytogenes TaxID=1639 RepID=UPI0010E3135A|nr:ERF family protein [Listeria monocytogenes]EAC6449906.1 single-stranded DNA-binding protein [Listeria monocytogenes]EAG4664063.1 single-stranded DNA-binding protein [Listeria monocytogenes]MEB2462828.1 ERF family protein [Listeria monocytogenes]NVT28299.1 ERF family protein [Listeria monocytogenes]HCY9089924.1 ERF family protein [Listeria monocytogenes]
MKMSESIIELSVALSKFQEKVEQPAKTAKNPFFNSSYVPLEKVISAVKKHAPDLGLSYIQIPLTEENKVGVKTILMHSSGEFVEFDPFMLSLDKNTAQGAGSALTYARRYTLSAAFGIASDEDDDGNDASGNTKANNSSKNYQKTKQTQPTQQSDNLASPAQRKAIFAKASVVGEPFGHDAKYVLESYKVTDTKSMSKGEASALIKKLDAEIEAQKQVN